ncbi:MAG: hypothetical protein ACLUGJ_10020 [Blautia wexlerae]
MNRTIEYTIPESQNGLRVEQFLRRKGILPAEFHRKSKRGCSAKRSSW